MLVKPIMHLFTGEEHNKQYRNFLSKSEYHREHPIFSELMEKCIVHFDGFNAAALDARPSDLVPEEQKLN
jgi:hypothetical protein